MYKPDSLTKICCSFSQNNILAICHLWIRPLKRNKLTNKTNNNTTAKPRVKLFSTKSFLETGQVTRAEWRGIERQLEKQKWNRNSKSTLTFTQLHLQQQVWVELIKAEALWLLLHTSTSCIKLPLYLSRSLCQPGVNRFVSMTLKSNQQKHSHWERLQQQTGVGVESVKSRGHMFISGNAALSNLFTSMELKWASLADHDGMWKHMITLFTSPHLDSDRKVASETNMLRFSTNSWL